MGKCYSKNISSVKEGGGGGCPLPPAPETASMDGATPPPSFASPGHSPYPGGSSPLLPVPASPPPGNHRRTLRWPFPPPSPAKPIMSAIFRLNGREKPKEGQGRDESTERPLDKRFGYAKNFAAKYELGKEVGQGHFGHTRCARVKKGELKGQSVAVKIIPKAKMTTTLAIEDVRREVKILKALSGHENLVIFHDACEDDNNVYIIMELCEGGELLQRILSSGGRYREDDAKLTVACILKVVAFCHLQGVVHRDLKPENFLFTTRDVDASMKLIDFGLSDFVKADQRLNDIVGSAYYVAPEVLRKSYNLEADMWSIGVIAYILLCGSRPFWARTETGIFRSVLRSHPNFDDAPWPTISSEAKDFVKRLLNKDSRKRMTAAQALTHPWIRHEDNDVPLDILIYKSVKSYIRATPLRRAILKALSKALPDDDLVYLRAQFRLLEPKNGLISHENFKVALLKQATDAMKESRVPDILNAMEPHSLKKMDFEEFCAAAISAHQLEALEGWERISSTAFEFFEEEGNRVTSVAELAQEMNLGPSTYSLFNDWIRDSDRKLSFLGYTKFLHGVTVRSGSSTRQL